MRDEDDAAFRARQAANTAARDTPNIRAWGPADVSLDGRFVAEKRAPLSDRSGMSPA
jgi:hypothetical protein